MISSAAAKAQPKEGYWLFLRNLVKTPVVRKVESRDFVGNEMIAELKKTPVFDFGSFSIDFNSDTWDFSHATSLNIPSYKLIFRFESSPMKDEAKLFAITSILWQKCKVQTIVAKNQKILSLARTFSLTPDNLCLLTKEKVERWERKSLESLALQTVSNYLTNLLDLIRFHELLFEKATDRSLISYIESRLSFASKIKKKTAGYPAIPDEYLVPLLDCCKRELAVPIRSGHIKEDTNSKTIAAALVLLENTGFRLGELLALRVNAITSTPAPAEGLPSLASLSYISYKGSSGDGRFKKCSTVISDEALRAYETLTMLCQKRRKSLDTDYLIVFYCQLREFCSVDSFESNYKRFIAKHRAELPCLNTQDAFPELQTIPARRAAAGTQNGVAMADLWELKEDDVLVYPALHSFRTTFAMRLRNEGYDLELISKFMNHISADTTKGYIHAEEEVNRDFSTAVHDAIINEGAHLIGPNGAAFEKQVRQYAENLPGDVLADTQSIIEACGKHYPLRRKLGGVCIKCGTVNTCPSNTKTDQVFCAFGVCPNQCTLYFMLDIHLDEARSHMVLVDENKARGHTAAASNELRKAQNVISGIVVPEMKDLCRILLEKGEKYVISRHPHMAGIVKSKDRIEKEIESWMAMKM